MLKHPQYHQLISGLISTSLLCAEFIRAKIDRTDCFHGPRPLNLGMGQVDYLTKMRQRHFVCLCWSFTAQSTMRSCRAGQLTVTLFLGRLRPSKRLTGTKQGRPRQ